MMIASPTAASAAATVMTKKTNTCPATPCTWANATKARFTALSMSSTHMKMMIAFRRVSTPTTPIVNSTAEKNSDSFNIGASPSQDYRTHDRGEQQDARQLECEQILGEQRPGDGCDRTVLHDVRRQRAWRQRQRIGDPHAREREHLGDEREADETRRELPPEAARIRELGGMAEVEQHDDEQEHHHDRARVHQHLDRTDELRIQQDVERGEAEHRVHEPERRRRGRLARDEQQRRHDGDDAEQVEVKGVEQRKIALRHHSPLGSAGSHISHTGCVCAIRRSRSYTNPSREYSEFS